MDLLIIPKVITLGLSIAFGLSLGGRLFRGQVVDIELFLCFGLSAATFIALMGWL